jgi:GrpB-like predicted nucleotidyltransferase (UPF0157 family)
MVFVTRQDGKHWRALNLFRDLLRSDAALRQQYQELKNEQAARLPLDRDAYREAKSRFIARVLAR